MSGSADSGAADAVFGRLAAFRAEIKTLAWFGACGAPFGDAERALAQGYVASLGLGDLPVAAVPDWRQAEATIRRADWGREWWEAETAAEQALHRMGAARYGRAPLLKALTEITEEAVALRDHAAAALARAGISSEALAKVAGGAVGQACHQRALALLTEAPDHHAFVRKFRLFARGRWPLGVVARSCFVF